MDGLADGWTKELIDRWMEELTDGRIEELTDGHLTFDGYQSHSRHLVK